MATGDDAAAAGMDLVAQTGKVRDGATELNKTRDYIALKAVLKSAVTTVGNALLAAATAAAARSAIGLTTMSQAADANTLAQRDASGNLIMTTGFAAGGTGPNSGHLTTRGYVDGSFAGRDAAIAGKYDKTGGTVSGDVAVTGNVYTPNSGPGGAGTITYMQTSDGRLTRGVSARKYKKNIRAVDAASLGDIFPQLVEYEMKVAHDRSGRRMLGHIADDMLGRPAERFVVLDNDGQVDAYDVIQLLLAQNAQLHARVTALEARDA